MKPPRRRSPIPATTLTPEDARRLHRDGVRLKGEMAKLLDLDLEDGEDELRDYLIALGLPEGSKEHEATVRDFLAIAAEHRARPKRR